jgi:hypothetical protein
MQEERDHLKAGLLKQRESEHGDFENPPLVSTADAVETETALSWSGIKVHRKLSVQL